MDHPETFGNEEINLDLRKSSVAAYHWGEGYTANSKRFTVSGTAVGCIMEAPGDKLQTNYTLAKPLLPLLKMLPLGTLFVVMES